MREKPLQLHATTDADSAHRDADFVVIATPTNYDPVRNYFDTVHAEEAHRTRIASQSQCNYGHQEHGSSGLSRRSQTALWLHNFPLCTRILRESKALYDNLYPSRIIVGRPEDEVLKEKAHQFAALLQEGAITKENIDTLYMGLTEAEAVAFANTYLALRVSFSTNSILMLSQKA